MALKVAMHNWMRPEPIVTTIERLARAGYDGIEIAGEPAVYDVGEVRSLLDQHGLECWGSVTIMVGGRDLLHEDKIVRMGSPEDEWRWAVESLREVNAYAEDKGIRLALEPLNRFETYFLNRHDQALALAEDVGGTCGVCLDIFHMNIEEADWEQALRTAAAADKLVDVHVADNNRMPCGQGAVDWAKFIGTLEEIGYDDYLTVEFVVTVDRSRISERTEIGDASEAEASVGLEQFLRDHGTGAVPDALYDRFVKESIDELRRHIGARQATP